jgi:hypothetical protein
MESQIWMVLTRQRFCWAMISWGSVRLVRRNLAIAGGTVAAISAISGSGMIPGPLGISETSPSAVAPRRMARRASSIERMQQIFTRVIAMTLPPSM